MSHATNPQIPRTPASSSSPTGQPIPSPSQSQDSPIYRYVSSLSPIKPVNAMQAYENTDVPSPQMVFKTPNFNRQRNSSLVERSGHLASSGSDNLSVGFANNTITFSGSMDMHRTSVSMAMSQSISCNVKECRGTDPSSDQPSVSPSCVDAYLVDPSESDGNLSNSPDFCVKRDVNGTPLRTTSSNKNQMKCFKENPSEDNSQPPINVGSEMIDDSSSTPAALHDLHLKKDVGLSHPLKNDSTDDREATAELCSINCAKNVGSKAVESSNAHCQTEGHSGEVPMTCVSWGSPQHQTEEDPRNEHMSEENFDISGVSNRKQFGQLPNNANIDTETLLQPSSNTQQHNVENQYATDHPVVAITKDCGIGSHEQENSSTPSFGQGLEGFDLLTSKADQSNNLDCMRRLHPNYPNNIQEYDNHIDNSGLVISASTGSRLSYDQEDGTQNQRGKRKRLQFEAFETGCDSNSCSLILKNSKIESPITPFQMETTNASQAEPLTISTSKSASESVPGQYHCRLSVQVDIYGGYQGSSPITAPRPSGIGLHLNSIGSTGSMICNVNMQIPTRDASVHEESCIDDNNQLSQKLKNCLASRSSIGFPHTVTSSSENPSSCAGTDNYEEKHPGDRTIPVPNSSINYQSPMFVKPINQSLPSKITDRFITPCTMKRIPSEEASKSVDSTQSSPRKKKKALENQGHKRCNCKKTKCLKLYCDCFAAGAFCTEACSCQGCFNKSEHEYTIRETRQQIESRNPLAFAPKVVVRVTDPPKDSDDSKPITPTSARHKRGCNCKKSLCLKKYCECYQSGVGCSLACRCEGCKNTFGTKEGCGGISEMVVEHKRPEESWERNLSGELESIEVKRGSANTKQSHYSGLSPVTPLVQTSLGNHVPIQFPASYYPSPESRVSDISSYESFNTASDSIQNDAFAKEREGSLALVPYGPDVEYRNDGDVNPFSPGWEGFPEIGNLSPLLKTPSAGGSSSASKTREHKILHTQLFQGSGRVSLANLCYRSSPATPKSRFGERKILREPNSDNGLDGIPEDDTPEILKETRSPIKTVKATSPNQKRVSPPHRVVSLTRSSSPSAVRNGRKFILQSVPTFPSLTPYSNNTRGGT